jgi:hypothetical protein
MSLTLQTLRAVCLLPTQEAELILMNYPKDVNGHYRVPLIGYNHISNHFKTFAVASVFTPFTNSETYYYEY